MEVLSILTLNLKDLDNYFNNKEDLTKKCHKLCSYGKIAHWLIAAISR